MLKQLKEDLEKLKNSIKAQSLARFFKTGQGEYGEGDVFLGVTVPAQREIAKKYSQLDLPDIQKLLHSKIHEHRLTALFILVAQYKKAAAAAKKKIFNFYLKNTTKINNWDLVDSSAHYIVGEYLFDKDRSILYNLARSKNIWEKRIAVISIFTFIRHNDFTEALRIFKILLNDDHDLIHKAVGWMLREIGNRNLKIEEKFLKKHYQQMPRTMLRYAIEKFPESKRRFYLTKLS